MFICDDFNFLCTKVSVVVISAMFNAASAYLASECLVIYSYLVGCCPISDLFGEPVLGEA